MDEPNLFPSSFDQRCPECDSPIWQGDLVGWVDDTVCCEECVREYR